MKLLSAGLKDPQWRLDTLRSAFIILLHVQYVSKHVYKVLIFQYFGTIALLLFIPHIMPTLPVIQIICAIGILTTTLGSGKYHRLGTYLYNVEERCKELST